MRGRKPKPSHLKLVTGNPGRRPMNNEPVIPPALPDAPGWITGTALDEWNRIAPLLAAVGLLTHLDRTAIGCYCLHVGHLLSAQEMLARDGMTVTSPTGIERPSPHWYIAAKATAMVLQWGSEFGLSPSSRGRLNVDMIPADDEFQRYLDRGPKQPPAS